MEIGLLRQQLINLLDFSKLYQHGLTLSLFGGFALVSGFIYSYLQRINHYKSFFQLLKKKFQRLIVPYIFTYIFTCIAWIIPITQYFDHYSVSTIVS